MTGSNLTNIRKHTFTQISIKQAYSKAGRVVSKKQNKTKNEKTKKE